MTANYKLTPAKRQLKLTHGLYKAYPGRDSRPGDWHLVLDVLPDCEQYIRDVIVEALHKSDADYGMTYVYEWGGTLNHRFKRQPGA